MRKTKLLLSFGSAITVLAPSIAAISCSDMRARKDSLRDLPILGGAGTANPDAFSTWSLRSEALRINGGKPWDQKSVWKNGYRYESFSQGISMLTAVAEELGYNMKESLIKNNETTPALSVNNKVFIDESNVNKSAEDILKEFNVDIAAANINLNDPNDDTIKQINELKAIKYKKIYGTEVDANGDLDKGFYKLSLANPNQQIENVEDLSRSNLAADWATDQWFIDHNNSATHNGYTGKYLIQTWYDHKHPGDQVVTFAPCDDVMGKPQIDQTRPFIVRSINVKDTAGSYPLIANDIFEKDYMPAAKQAILELLNKVQSTGGLGFIKNMIPIRFLSLFEFLLQNTVTDVTGSYPKFVNESQVENILIELNKTKVFNWLAIKAFVVGYDESFATDGYEPWDCWNWADGVKNNKDVPTQADGLMNPDFSITAASGDADGLTSWMHTPITGLWNSKEVVLYDPSTSLEDNYKLNKDMGITVIPEFKSDLQRETEFIALVDEFKKKTVSGFVLPFNLSFVSGQVTKISEEKFLSFKIPDLPTEVKWEDISVTIKDATKSEVTIKASANNKHLSTQSSIDVSFDATFNTVSGANRASQLINLKNVIKPTNLPVIAPSPFPWVHDSGIEGANADLSAIKVFYNDADLKEIKYSLDLSKVGNTFTADEIIGLLLSSFSTQSVHSLIIPSEIEALLKGIDKLSFYATIKAVDNVNRKVTFTLDVLGGSPTDSYDFDVILP